MTGPDAPAPRRDRPVVSMIALVAANAIPLLGVIFLGWRVFPILLIYWIENVMVGVFNVLRMLFADPDQPLEWFAKLFMVPFFCFHYGLFTFVHGAFVFEMFGDSTVRHGFPTIAKTLAAVQANGVNFAVLALFMSHFVSFIWNYLLRGEYRNVSLALLMAQPYQRVVVLHLVIILGGAGATALGSPMAAVAVLVGIKTVLDIAAHKREREKLAGDLTRPAMPAP